MEEPQSTGLDPDGDRAERTRRARVRHLLAAAQGARRVPGRAGQRHHGEPDRRADAVPRIRESGQGHPLLHQLAGRLGVGAGMAIYDTMQFIKPDVSTLCVGMAASMGAFLLAAGAKGKRFALPNSTVMIHQPLGRVPGPGFGHRAPRAVRDRPASSGFITLMARIHRASRSSRSSATTTATISCGPKQARGVRDCRQSLAEAAR